MTTQYSIFRAAYRPAGWINDFLMTPAGEVFQRQSDNEARSSAATFYRQPYITPEFFIQHAKAFTTICDTAIINRDTDISWLLAETPDDFRAGLLPPAKLELPHADVRERFWLLVGNNYLDKNAVIMTSHAVFLDVDRERFQLYTGTGKALLEVFELCRDLAAQNNESIRIQIRHEQRIEAAAENHFQGFYHGNGEGVL